MEHPRLALWTGDGPLNARDAVITDIRDHIVEALNEARTDSCWLNEVVAYLRCLLGVIRETGGEELIAEEIDGWRISTLALYDSMDGISEPEIQRDRSFITETFDLLERRIKL